MSNTASNVSVGKPKISGAIFRAPLGTTLPTDASTALTATFKAMGYVSADGLTNANKISTNNIKAWGGDTVLVSQTDKTDTLAFTLIEALNSDVLSAVFGSDNVSGTLATGISISVNAEVQEEAVWVVDMVLNGDTAKRIVVPDGVISDLADIVYKDDTAIGYGVTISCLPDSSGNTHYEYLVKAST
jgi:hypothetical protein